jgi:hypothetical protein
MGAGHILIAQLPATASVFEDAAMSGVDTVGTTTTAAIILNDVQIDLSEGGGLRDQLGRQHRHHLSRSPASEDAGKTEVCCASGCENRMERPEDWWEFDLEAPFEIAHLCRISWPEGETLKVSALMTHAVALTFVLAVGPAAGLGSDGRGRETGCGGLLV